MNILSRSIFILFLFSASWGISAQEKVKWLTFEEAIELSKKEKKKIFIDMYTDWCGWCKKMDKATFQQPHIASYLNEHFYPVKFNAEQKADISFNNQLFKYVKSGRRGYHQLAAELSKSLGRLSFPTIIFLDENHSVIQPIPGYQDPKSFEVIMTFIGGDYFKDTPWKKYSTTFKSQIVSYQ
jgi:thioredoxin-related protein